MSWPFRDLETAPPLEVVPTEDCFWIAGELVGDDAVAKFTELRELTAAADWDTLRLNLSGVTSSDSVGLSELLLLITSLPRVRITAINEGLELRN